MSVEGAPAADVSQITGEQLLYGSLIAAFIAGFSFLVIRAIFFPSGLGKKD